MRVLVAGATGFLGREVVRNMAASGHEVRGLVRYSGQFDLVRSLGATPWLGDLETGAGLAEAVAGCDEVIHLAQPREGGIAARQAVRVDGGRRLARAAVDARVRRFLVGSGYWVYRGDPGVISEESATEPRSISQVNFEAEQAVLRESRSGSMAVAVVRPGMVYGPGSWFLEMVTELRAGSYVYIGDGSNYLSPVHLEDCADAFRTIAESEAAEETYLVVDDAPVTTRAFADDIAHRLGAPEPRSITMEKAKQEWGGDLAILNSASRRASNAKLRRLGWKPRFSTYATGVPGILAEIGRAPSSP